MTEQGKHKSLRILQENKMNENEGPIQISR